MGKTGYNWKQKEYFRKKKIKENQIKKDGKSLKVCICWNCNDNNINLKKSNDNIYCLKCQQMYYKGRVINYDEKDIQKLPRIF